MQDDNNYFKVLSWLLQFPDEDYLQELSKIKTVVDTMHDGPRKASLQAFLEYLESDTGLKLQERYTALFDMAPATTLNMTYHLLGDSEERARLLTRLQQEYACGGLEKRSPELPDYLPLILEFMAAVPRARQSAPIARSLKGLRTLVERLAPTSAAYAGLLAPLSEMYGAQDRERSAPALG